MPHIIADTPMLVNCLIRREFTQNFESGHGEYIKAHLIGIRCQQALSLQFQVRFEDKEHGGAMFCLPIQALCWKPCDRPPSELVQPWDTFSSTFGAHSFSLLKNTKALLLNTRKCEGYPERIESRYLWTIDFEESPLADCFEQHKQLHVLQVSGGWFAAVPNNRVLMHDSAFSGVPDELPRFKSLAAEFSAEVDFHLPERAPAAAQYADAGSAEKPSDVESPWTKFEIKAHA